MKGFDPLKHYHASNVFVNVISKKQLVDAWVGTESHKERHTLVIGGVQKTVIITH